MLVGRYPSSNFLLLFSNYYCNFFGDIDKKSPKTNEFLFIKKMIDGSRKLLRFKLVSTENPSGFLVPRQGGRPVGSGVLMLLVH
jgi:hypothetical protein